MSYANQTVNNKSFIKRFSHKIRFNVALSFLNLKSTDTLLDFGTGDGYLLQLVSETKAVKELVGYDPLPKMYDELKRNIESHQATNIKVINNLNDVAQTTFNYVTCFEVLEHFSETEQLQHLEDIKRLTDSRSKIIISVPLEIGLTALLKNSIRIIVGQKHSNSSLKSVTKAILGFKDTRTQSGYIHSHVGFNHKDLEKLFKASGLKIIKKQYSPFKYLYGILNSQIFYELERV
ncbi:class I SAM-dependent methyltransferase [Hanstruepera marina]|uniref:class I SAM-dependent methyltransferase n=1 Tax=Hanstruepera marina TaxID=2873265 RepID=UPI001CA61BBE|nr:methyltransferase domain-containing protein [Hanstruepera marina]